MPGDLAGALSSSGSTSMKRNSCTLTASSLMVQSMSRSSHQAGLNGSGPCRSSAGEDLPAISAGQPFQFVSVPDRLSCIARDDPTPLIRIGS